MKGPARPHWRSPQPKPRASPAAKPPVPSYKIIPGTDFLVDGFTWKDASKFKSYFLSHFHSDHYVGITKGFHHGKIYCSPTTANLVRNRIGVRDDVLVRLGLNQWHDIEGHGVVLLEANHCPGAVLFLFRVNDRYYLHTGDFRYSPRMKEYQELKGIEIEGLFLDTTFLNPKYNFPAQDIALQAAAEIALKEDKPGTLILIGTYQIGKERVLLSVAKALNKKVFVTEEKWKLLSCLDIDHSHFVRDPMLTNVHVVPLNWLNFQSMGNVLNKWNQGYSRVVGISPTGWNNSPKPHENYVLRKQGFVSIYGVPYSEHCSYSELREFVSWINPKKIIPTVHVEKDNTAVHLMLKHFEEKPLKKPDYGTLFPLLQRMRSQAEEQRGKLLAQQQAREELKGIENEEEEPPIRLVVADSRLLLLEASEPEDSYVKSRSRRHGDDADDSIVISDDDAAEDDKHTLKGYLETHTQTIDLEYLAGDAAFVHEQRQMEVLFTNDKKHQQQQQQHHSPQYATPPAAADVSKTPTKARRESAVDEGAVTFKKPKSTPAKKAKKLTRPDPLQPTLFSFLTRSKSSNME